MSKKNARRKGYVPPASQVLRLEFTDGDLAGLKVRATAATGGDLEKLSAMAAAGADPDVSVLRVFAEHLRSWNLLNTDGEAQPPNLDTLLWLDLGLALRIVGGWLSASGKAVADAAAGDLFSDARERMTEDQAATAPTLTTADRRHARRT